MRAWGTTASDEGRVRRLLIVFLVTGLSALIVAVIASFSAARSSAIATQWVNHTYEVRGALQQVETLVERSETARRGYLLSGEQRFVNVQNRAQRELVPVLSRLRGLISDNAAQRQRLARTRNALATLDNSRAPTVALRRAGQVEAARRSFVGEGDAANLAHIRKLVADMGGEENRLLVTRSQSQQNNLRWFFSLLVVAGIVLLLVVTAAALLVRRYTIDLGQSRATLRQLNETLEDQVRARTADLSLANEEIQRFAYIVSHDLRSPLVNVMGFTAELSAAVDPLQELIARAEATAPEIVSDDARLAAREDLPEAIGFIRSSTAKMDRLINAILQLSRQGRRTLAPEDLDIGAVAEAVVAAIRHVIDDRGVTVEIARPMPQVATDRLAIEQILSNLVENATKYLQPGRPGHILITARSNGDRVLVRVEDNGRGIDPRDHQRIFDLFRRSGTQDQTGEGIGLAHVRALAYRLAGTINVESELGIGSTFTLSLPTTIDQEPS